MAVFKCKMCCGALDIQPGQSIATCMYCGTPQTLPRLDDDRRANLYDRANHYRSANEFDKAMGIYEQILNEDQTDAEAYWSLVLCRYGIEYVEDPASGRRVPTVNRMQYASILADEDYKSALEHADDEQRALYEEEARAIDTIQKGILAISQKEEPFDVFICYKESDAEGRRTHDSVLAQDLYYQLKREGFKVFFSRITLEDKLGSAYEPYIFAALNSAKVMVVLGTKPEFFNAVWVKNEWSRYLAMIKKGEQKILIPAYKDMDPYDMPEEFSHLQAQDMSKLGFMQDIIRGIKKIARSDEPKAAPVAAAPAVNVVAGEMDITPLLRRINMFLEDGDWANADAYCERVLDRDPENAQAYLMKLLAKLQLSREEELVRSTVALDNLAPYKNAIRFADEETAERLMGYAKKVQENMELAAQRAEEVRVLRSDRQQAMDLYNSNMKRKVGFERNLKDKEAQIARSPKPLAVVICSGIAILFAILIIFAISSIIALSNEYNVYNEEAVTLSAIWLVFCCLAYFVMVGVTSCMSRRSFGWTFLNVPTLGIFGVIYVLVLLIKYLVKGNRDLLRERDQIRARLQEASAEVDRLSMVISEIDIRLADLGASVN